MPRAEMCECQSCRAWRQANLPFGSVFHTNLTKESVDALAKQNEPRGRRAAKRAARGK